MTTTADTAGKIPWWMEPTKDQWLAWVAAWLGWTLDAFDFTIFLLLMVPIAEAFKVPLVESRQYSRSRFGCALSGPSAPDGWPTASDARHR
jgi:hypothetical protein